MGPVYSGHCGIVCHLDRPKQRKNGIRGNRNEAYQERIQQTGSDRIVRRFIDLVRHPPGVDALGIRQGGTRRNGVPHPVDPPGMELGGQLP
ncbi:hypothetical protein D3C76_1499440 [compost metagenome]